MWKITVTHDYSYQNAKALFYTSLANEWFVKQLAEKVLGHYSRVPGKLLGVTVDHGQWEKVLGVIVEYWEKVPGVTYSNIKDFRYYRSQLRKFMVYTPLTKILPIPTNGQEK